MSVLDENAKAIAAQREWEAKLLSGNVTTEELNKHAPVGHEWSEDQAKYVPAGQARAGAVEENPFMTYNPMLIGAGMGGIAGKVTMKGAATGTAEIATRKGATNLLEKAVSILRKGRKDVGLIVWLSTVLMGISAYLAGQSNEKYESASMIVQAVKYGHLTEKEAAAEIDQIPKASKLEKDVWKSDIRVALTQKENDETRIAAGLQAAQSYGFEQAPGEPDESLAGRGTSQAINLQQEALKSQADKEARIAAGPYPQITASNVNLEEYARLMHDVSRQKQGISPGVQANEGVLTEELKKAVMMAPQATVEFINSMKLKAQPKEPSTASIQTKPAGMALQTPVPAPPNPMLGYEDPFRQQSILRKKKK
jgi:hypothetical protein